MFSFFIPGKPQGKERPRVTKYGTYTPERTKKYEELVKHQFLEKYDKAKPISEKMPVAAFIIAYFKQPKGLTKAERELIAQGKMYPTVKPDADNIGKAIMDSLNGLAYKDDNQITDVKVCKRFAEPGQDGKAVVFITSFAEHPELFGLWI